MVILYNNWKTINQIFGAKRKSLEDLFVFDILHQAALVVQVQVQAPVFQVPHHHTLHLDMFLLVIYLTSHLLVPVPVQAHPIIRNTSVFHHLIFHHLPPVLQNHPLLHHPVVVPCLLGHPQQELQIHGPVSATVVLFLRALC